MLDDEFAGRILSFDDVAAVAYAQLCARRRRAGAPIGTSDIGVSDAMIAAVALASGVQTLVTRNRDDFRDAGLEVVDPWAS